MSSPFAHRREILTGGEEFKIGAEGEVPKSKAWQRHPPTQLVAPERGHLLKLEALIERFAQLFGVVAWFPYEAASLSSISAKVADKSAAVPFSLSSQISSDER